MRMDKLTTLFQNALADAQSLALGRDHQFIEPLHLLVAMLDQQGGGTRALLTQAGVKVDALSEHQLTLYRRHTVGVMFQRFNLLPTLVELAGLPPALPTAGGPPIDGSSMARFLAPGGESAGWKDAAFSQFPRCHNRTKFRPIDVFCVGVESVDFEFMGLAIRVDGWRQIEWYEWCGTAPCWDRLNATELYEQSEEGRAGGG